MSSRIYLRDVKITLSKKVIFAALLLIGISIITSSVLSYMLTDLYHYGLFGAFVGSGIGASIGVSGNYLLLTKKKIIRHFTVELTNRITLKDKESKIKGSLGN